MNPLVRAGMGGVGAGILGAAIWAAISYFANLEIGWIAWGIGGLVGLGVRVMAGENEGVSFGVLALVIALVSILGGKYAAVSLAVGDVEKEFDNIQFQQTDETMVNVMASKVAEEWQAQNKPVYAKSNPIPKQGEEFQAPEYLPAVMKEAQRRWSKLPAEEKQRMKDEEQKAFEDFKENFVGEVRNKGFKDSFSPFDFLFFGLAAFTAFRLGSGAVGE